ncbi:MAG TPA: M14 family zinc carboxypeptidase [Solirubrobacteraceae bacterium]|nr:M14 family zinc carboxypeptidase [Solirubrobacteraceae bacterium]
MSRSGRIAALAVLASVVACAPAYADARNPINAYRVEATGKNLERLALAGFDVTEGRRDGKVEVYGTAGQLRKFTDDTGVSAELVRSFSAAQEQTLTGSDAQYKVWRRYDRVPGDAKEQYLELYDRLAQRSIVKRVDIGDTVLGRDIVALKVTANAKTTRDNSRPAVLYNAMQHAREWLAGETCRRTLTYFTDNYGKDPLVTRLVDTRELWFVCMANPDGYEYTFTPGNRLWRKNMADNDRDGVYGEVNDGVDPNRNFPVNWGLDDEGSSPDPTSETYRGPSAASEPETQAMQRLWRLVDFEFQKNDHTAAKLVLYPQGWQQYTPAADDAIFTALAGDDADPAIAGFDPDLGAELYITNGDTLDTAYNREGILAYTPEGSEPKDTTVSGFEFEDSESAIEAEFRRHRDFSLDLAESADKPEEPDSHLGNTVQDFYVDSFADSYGDPQTVQATAKRSLGAIVMRYRINGGATKTVGTSEWSDGERYYQEAGVYYHRLRGTVTGTKPGDNVEVWFAQKNGSKQSASFSYAARVESANRVLVLAAEDYTGPTPALDPSGPRYADQYLAAVAANGLGADLYDVDARGRRAPHPLGVLSHYDAVIWYTGDDYLTREPGQVPGTGTSRLALDEQVAVRDYLNEGGKVVYAGKHAGQQYAEGYEFRNFGFPQPNEDQQGRWCDADLPESRDGCIAHTNDFLQYYLGAYIRVENGNAWSPDGSVFPVAGEDPFAPGTSWTFANQAADPAAGAPTSTFAVTSTIIDNPTYQDSRRLAGWTRPGAGPFAPFTGQYYMASGADDEAYKRLWTEVDLTGATSGKVKFKMSFDVEQDWDYVFVEARPVGTEQWTTLPDVNGHTSQATGFSCWDGGGWGADLHDRLLNYQTPSRDTCTPTGTTGEWHAATGSSNGWQDWEVDLSRFAGQKVEVAIVQASDWAFLNLGAWVDDATVEVGGATSSQTSFEADAGVWQVGGAPASTPNPDPQWTRSTEQFQEGAVVGTTDTVYAGFEIATMSTAAERASFIRASLRHLGVLE